MIFVTSRAFVRKAALEQRILRSPISKHLLPLPGTKNRKEGVDKGDVSYLGVSSTPQKFSHPQIGPDAILRAGGTERTTAEMKRTQPNHPPPSRTRPPAGIRQHAGGCKKAGTLQPFISYWYTFGISGESHIQIPLLSLPYCWFTNVVC